MITTVLMPLGPVGREQRCCKRSYRTRGSPSQGNAQPPMLMALRLRNPDPEVWVGAGQCFKDHPANLLQGDFKTSMEDAINRKQFSFFLEIFEWHRERESESEREGERGHSHLPVHSQTPTVAQAGGFISSREPGTQPRSPARVAGPQLT